MTKDEKTIREVREEDGEQVEYICSPVKHGGNQVGFAPRRATKDLDEMLGVLEPEKIHSLADRQLDQDNKNAVRAKFTKEAVTASAVVKALAAGTLKDADVRQVMQSKNLQYIPAANVLMGVGKDAKIEPKKIHWDIL